MGRSLRLRVKRIYEPPSAEDGARLLVDRLWPRGLKTKEVPLDGWIKDVAPSSELRRWFGHDAARWREFHRRYFKELDEKSDACRAIARQARRGTVTLLYSARDVEHNNAVALADYLRGSTKK